MGRTKKIFITDTKKDIIEEIYKPARRNFLRRHIIIRGLDDIWQADLADVQNLARDNKNYKYILVVIDCFSKFLWMKALKTKNANEVTAAMDSILKEGRKPKNLQTDQGKEFFNTHFNKLMKKYNINHYNTYSVKKAAIAERVIRTIKSKMYRLFSLNGSYKWIDKLNFIANEYNNTKHRTIKRKPIEINKSNENQVTAYNHPKIFKKHKFKRGDYVRISKAKYLFEKSYLPNWTTEIFKISKLNVTNPATYLLEDMQGQPIKGCFYEPELQKVKHKDAFLVEKVLRTRGKKAYVKWLGFDQSHNSWINESDIV